MDREEYYLLPALLREKCKVVSYTKNAKGEELRFITEKYYEKIILQITDGLMIITDDNNEYRIQSHPKYDNTHDILINMLSDTETIENLMSILKYCFSLDLKSIEITPLYQENLPFFSQEAYLTPQQPTLHCSTELDKIPCQMLCRIPDRKEPKMPTYHYHSFQVPQRYL